MCKTIIPSWCRTIVVLSGISVDIRGRQAVYFKVVYCGLATRILFWMKVLLRNSTIYVMVMLGFLEVRYFGFLTQSFLQVFFLEEL